MINNKKLTITTCFLAATGMAIIPNTALANNDPVIENTESTELAIGSTFTHENIIYKVIAKNDNNIEVQVGNGAPITNVSGLLRLNGNFNKDNKNFIVTQIGEAAFSGQDSKITEIVIPNTVVKINNKAFQAAEKLQKVTFEDSSSLTSIGDEAFESANKLSSIDIPDSVTNIGEAAFSSAEKLETVKINPTSSLTNIGINTFLRSPALKSIYIPKNVSSIGDRAISNNTSLKSIEVAADNKFYSSHDGALYKDKRLIIYPAAKESESYSIKEGTEIIEENVFYKATKLKHISMPNSITKIKKKAFWDTTSLETIKFSENLKEIEGHAFRNLSLKELILPDSLTKVHPQAFNNFKKVEKVYIGKNLSDFSLPIFVNDFSKVKEVTIASENPNIAYNSMVFLDTNNDVKYTVHSENAKKSLQKAILGLINSKGKLKNLPEDKKQEIVGKYDIKIFNSSNDNDGNLKVGDIIENNKISYKIVKINDKNVNVAIGDGSSFVKADNNEFVIPEKFIHDKYNITVTEIATKAFTKGSNVTKITIPTSITKIQKQAFDDNDKITNLKLPDSVVDIDNYAFSDMKELKTIKLPNNLKTLKSGVFYHLPKLEELFIPDSVTKVEGAAIANLNALKKLYVGKNVSMLDNGFMAGEFDSLKIVGIANRNLQSHGDAVPLAEVLDFKILVTSKESQAIAKVAFDKENTGDIIIVDENKVLEYVKNYPNIDILKDNNSGTSDSSNSSNSGTSDNSNSNNSGTSDSSNSSNSGTSDSSNSSNSGTSDNSNSSNSEISNSSNSSNSGTSNSSNSSNSGTSDNSNSSNSETSNSSNSSNSEHSDNSNNKNINSNNTKQINLNTNKTNNNSNINLNSSKILPNTGEMINNTTILLSLLSISAAAFLLIRKNKQIKNECIK